MFSKTRGSNEAAEWGDHHSALDSAHLHLNSQTNSKNLGVAFRVLGKSSSAAKHKGDLNSCANAKSLAWITYETSGLLLVL